LNLTLRQIIPSTTGNEGSEFESAMTRIAKAYCDCDVGVVCVATEVSALHWHSFQCHDGSSFAVAFSCELSKNDSVQSLGYIVEQHLKLARIFNRLSAKSCYAIENDSGNEEAVVHTFKILPRLSSIDSIQSVLELIHFRGELPELTIAEQEPVVMIEENPVLGWALQFPADAITSLSKGPGEYVFANDQAKILLCDADQSFVLKLVGERDRDKFIFLVGERVDMEESERSLAVTISLGEVAIPANAVAQVRPGASVVIDRPAVLEAVLKVGERAWAEAEVEITESEIVLRIKNLVAV